MELTYFGILKAPTSWAKVCRELVAALVDLNLDLNIYERKGFLFNSDFHLKPQLSGPRVTSFRDDIVFTFEHPGVYKYLEGKFKVGILTYESTGVPHSWVSLANRYLDLLLVSSSFCKEIFIDAGMDPSKIDILHYGYDPDIYRQDGPATDLARQTGKQFNFINVVSPHKRKGLEILLDAYADAFNAADDVAMNVKVNYLPSRKHRPFEYADIPGMFERFSEQPNAPTLHLLTDFYSEREIAALYRGASCLASATRGEGFGMVFLEALACGLPIITTGWSGQMDFLSSQNASLVDYQLRPAREIQYDNSDDQSQIAEPDCADLAQKMSLAYRGIMAPAIVPPGYRWHDLANYFVNTVASYMS